MRRCRLFCLSVITIVWSAFFYSADAVCECGSYYSDYQRIINGETTRPHQYPWMALVLYDLGNFNVKICGGSVINNYYVMTAAHCITHHDKFEIENLYVVLGVHDRFTLDEGKAKIYNVSKINVHPFHQKLIDPGGTGEYVTNDIALLKLRTEIIFDFYVKPICLPNRDEDYNGRDAVIIGWGQKTLDSDTSSRYLEHATVKVLSGRECVASKYGNVYELVKSQVLCAAKVGTDTCQGDSGGPLVVNVGDHLMVQIGIISFGYECAEPGYPGMYAKVSNYLDWIYGMTRDATYCEKPRIHAPMMSSTQFLESEMDDLFF